MSTAEELVIEIDRVLPARPETIWRAITTPELLARWLGPEGSSCTVQSLELTLGGKLALEVTIANGPTFGLYGYYEQIEPPRRLVHSWATAGEDIASTVIWDLEPVGDGTRLRLQHLGLTLPEDITQNDAGWRHLLDRLEQLLGDLTER